MAAAQKMGRGLKALACLLLCALTTPAASYYVTVAGLGGTPEYESQFTKWAADIDHQLHANGPETTVLTLTGNSAMREHIREALSRLSGEMKSDDAFALLLIGHGTFDGTDYKFNIPGPDITAAELASLLNRLPATRQLVVNMTSCSGAS
ncbi:MAG: hypothetical protein WB992_05500, partial [Bryobacteraceae bacterium]